jgi:hypothetical protein
MLNGSGMKRVREVQSGPVDLKAIQERLNSGWRVAAIEWEHDEPGKTVRHVEDPPFGLRVGDDCLHLQEHESERNAILLMLECVVQDKRLTQIADELNRGGYRTRNGAPWSPADIFSLLPRLIEVGPRIFPTEEWAERRKHLFKAVG